MDLKTKYDALVNQLKTDLPGLFDLPLKEFSSKFIDLNTVTYNCGFILYNMVDSVDNQVNLGADIYLRIVGMDPLLCYSQFNDYVENNYSLADFIKVNNLTVYRNEKGEALALKIETDILLDPR